MDMLNNLWKILLTQGITQAKRFCEPDAGTLPDDVATIVNAMDDRDALSRFLSKTATQEKTVRGWDALYRGLAYLALGQSGQARTLFETASDTEDCRIATLLYLATLYLQQGLTNLADKTIREGISLGKTIGEFHLIKARLHLLDQAVDQANTQYEIALQKGNCSPLGLKEFELARLVVQDRQDEAIKAAVALLRDRVEGASVDQIAAVGLGILMTCGALEEADNFLDQSLEKEPDNQLLLIHRADIAALRGRYRMAGMALSRALARDKDNIALLTRKADLAGQAFPFDQGLSALDQIMEQIREQPPPDRAVYIALYGRIHFDRGDEDAAAAAYERALETDPKCISALAGLAGVMTVQGRLEKARDLQDRMYEIAPVRAMQVMINSERIPEDERDIRRMADMAKKPGTPLPLRASLNLSLARVLQKRGEHPGAMDHADTANKLIRTFVSFNHKKQAEQVDRIIARMTRDFFNTRKGFGTACNQPLFILGMPRSGTTLVEQILGSHSRVFAGGELDMIPRMWRRLSAWERRLGSDYQKVPDCALELTHDQSVAFARKVEGEYRELMPDDAPEVHITDKLPHNFKNIGMIKLLFPEARIIYCRRHPGAIALSNYFTDYKARHGGMGFAYDLEWIGYEIADCQRLMAHWKALFGNAIHIVDYEELVADPIPVVKALLAYLELDWEERIMEFNRLKRPVKTASVVQVRQPLYTTSKERWRYYEDRLQPMFEALTERNSQALPEPVPLPDHEPSLFLKGMDLLQAGKNREAETLFRDLLDLYPRHAAAVHMLGAAYSNQGKIGPAYQCMKHSIQLNPNNPTWYENLAILLVHMRRPEQAEEVRRQGKFFSRNNTYLPDEEFSH